MTPAPPDWAQSLISMLVPARTRDSVVGDLLEEYRGTQVPDHGVAAANRWYIRQALGFLWAAAWPAGLALAGNLMGRLTLDIYIDPGADPAMRSSITTYIAMAIFVLSGFHIGRTTRQVAGAALAALAATAVATIAACVMTLACMGVAAAFVHPDARVWASLIEGLDIPAHVIAVIGTLLACVGAAFGRAFPKWPLPVSG